jgi:hypothetical protein
MRLRPEAEHVALPADVAPALVDPALWEAVQMVLTCNQEQAARNNPHPEWYLLRGGHLICGHCDRPMRAHQYSDRRGPEYHTPAYRCPAIGDTHITCNGKPSLPARAIDGDVWPQVYDFLTHRERVAERLEALRAEDPTAYDLKAIEAALANVERQQRKLVEHLLQMDDDAGAPIRAKLAEMAEQKRQLEAERTATLERRGAWELTQQRIDDLAHWCEQVAANAAELDFAGKRLAIEALDVRVKVWRTADGIRWELLGSAPLDTPAPSTLAYKSRRSCRASARRS